MTQASSLFLPRDVRALEGVHLHLVGVVSLARRRHSFIVLEGLRTRERQAQLVAQGKSRTMASRHLTGHAVDLAPWQDLDGDRQVDPDEINWGNFEGFRDLARVVTGAALELSVPIIWGGNWPTFRDGPHFELDRTRYP